MAAVEPVKLPRYVMFKSDNDQNLCLHIQKNDDLYLCFNSTARNLWGTHEVTPVQGQEDVVMIKCLKNLKWWKRMPDWNWVWANQSEAPSASQLDCLFKVVKVSPNKVALQCLANSLYVKRLTARGNTDALNASAPDQNSDPCAQMEVSEALSTRRVFDVEYLMDQLQTKNSEPIFLGSASGENNTTSNNNEVSLTISYAKTKAYSWSNSTTFTTGLSVTVEGGIPNLSKVGSTASTQASSTTEMGKQISETQTLSSTFIVKDARPGERVTIRVTATKATSTVPYKYKYQDTRVDGLVLPVDTGVDGIFTGVDMVDLKFEATDASGKKKNVQVKDV